MCYTVEKKEAVEMDVRAEKVLKSRKKKEIKRIYEASFPKEERMPFVLMLCMSGMKSTEFLAFYDADKLCGFVYMAVLGRQNFIMFFAVDENLRSKGYGSSILSWIQHRYPDNTIMVSIEPCREGLPDLAQKLRRKKFYMANGYQETGYEMKLGGQEQEILMYNGNFDKCKFRFFFLRYSCGTILPKLWKTEKNT